MDDFSLTYNASTNTSVAFAGASSNAGEATGTTDLTINVTNPDAVNATNVTITATGATGRISTFTTPVVAAGGSTTGTCTVSLANNLLCDGNENVTFTITGVSGGQGTPTIGAQATHTLTVQDDDVCLNTSVAFAGSDLTVNEADGTANLTLAITDFSPTVSTSVEVALSSGDAARINGYTTQTVTWPANDGTNKTVTLTLTDDALCNGTAALSFALQNLSGGEGATSIGTPATRNVTINDNEVAGAPVATTADPINSFDFTATWNTVSGATGYFLDVSTLSDFMGPLTDLVKWDFPSGSADVTADGGIPANTAQTISSTGTGPQTYAAGSLGTPDQAISATGWNSGDGTKWWEVNFSTTGYAALTVSSKQRSSGTGPRDFKVQYKIGAGGTWADVPSATITVGENFTSGVLNSVALPSACDDEAAVYLRWIMTSNTSVGGATVAGTGTSRIDDILITGREPSYLPGYENLPVGLVLSQPVTGLTPLTTYYYRVRSTGGCSSGANSNTIMVSTVPIDTYYSRATGDVNAAIWSDTPLGVAGPANWSAASNMVVQNGHVVTNTANVDVKNVTVETGGTLAFNANSTFNVNGDEAIFDGTLTAADNSTLALVGTSATILESTGGPLNLFDLSVNTPAGTLTDATIALRGTLSLEDGDFDASLGSVTLLSTETATARLGPVGATASYTGATLTVQRYIPAGKTNWRFLGSPVTGNTIANWQDDFFTAGYPGSAYPIFLDPPVTGELWPSIRQYDETVTDADVNAGLIGVESQNTVLAAGKGFAAWSGDNFVNTLEFTVDMTGEPRVANTPITLPMTWTDTGVPTSDGFNLVSNPVASPIDFELIDRGADVNNQYWIFDPAIGNNRAWTNGIGQGGANGIIQSSQGFWLKANGPAFATSVSEEDKVLAPTGGVFGGNEQPNVPMLRLFLTNDQNSFSDESIVVFEQGSPAYDVIDAQKLVFAHPQAPQLATRSAEGTDLSIDFHGAYSTAISIPVTVKAGVSGTYTLSAALSGITSLSCLSIEDLSTGTITPLVDGASYSFTLEAAAAPEARFILHGSAPVPFYAQDATCGAEDNGQATVVVESGPMDITWTDAFGNVLLQQTGIEAGTATFAGLGAGNYIVRVSTTEACGELMTEFTIAQPFVLEAAVEELSMASCPNTTDGVLGMLVMGGVAPYTYLWSNGAQTEDLVAGAGDYSLTVTDANGCTWTSDLLSIEAGEGPVAGISAENTVLVNTPLSFTSTTVLAETWAWDFGDGATSTEANPAHTYTQAGTYTVSLTVSYGDCMDVTTFDVSVELSTSVSNVASAQPVRAWVNGDQFVVEHAFAGTVNVELLDATGRQHLQRASGAGAGRILLPAADLSTGIWFVRLTSAGEQHTLRVPLVR